MAKVKVAINGFGRIGRAFLRAAQDRKEIEVVAINDLGNLENLAYLLKYDTAYGRAPFTVETKEGTLVAGGESIAFISERNPEALPWKKLGIDIVVEATGFFASYEKARVHLAAGAKRVVITAPVSDNPKDAGVMGATVLMGINEDALKMCDISSNASCTTNAASPLMQILHEAIGIEKALLNTVHGYTATQAIVDSPDAKDFRRGRAGAQNIVPSSTGAATATTEAIPDLTDKFDGIAMRVPVVVGSLVDVTFIAKRATTAEEVNDALRKAAKEKRWEKTFTVTEEELVSSDIIGSKHASIADLKFTRVVDGNLVKVLAWYDNEMGYTYSLLEHVIMSAKYL